MKNKDGLLKKITSVAQVLELLLAALVIIGIMVGLKDIFTYLIDIYRIGAYETYDIFRQFLAHVLLLVVGIELVFMLISHSVDSIIEFILLVIARKMLVHADTMVDLFLGTLSIAILFLTIKFIAHRKFVLKSEHMRREGKNLMENED